MKKNLFSILLTISFLGFGQYTQIPDEYFEIALLDLGVDDVFDHQVLTENIAHITELDVSSSNIQDLTGIEDFLALKVLEASANNLTQLDLSNNLELKILHIAINQLNSLDISNNLKLEYLRVHTNQLTDLDVSHNSALRIVLCDYNQIKEIDISMNPAMELLLARNNQLTFLDISNRNNYETFDFESTSNPDLLCITVDDVEFANSNWNDPNHTDSWTNFSLDCENMSIIEEDLNEISIYPNPTKNILNFSQELKEFTIYDLFGKSILKGNGNQINVSNLSKGTYLIKGITVVGKTINQKFIKN